MNSLTIKRSKAMNKESKLVELDSYELGAVCGGECNDSFWSRLGSHIGNWLDERAEEVLSWDPDDPRFKYR